jgi:CRP/FNR family cyclic AMP-dependent transcriptional regulator
MSQDVSCQSLIKTALGKDMDTGDCAVLSPLMSVRHLHDGEVLVRQGDTSKTLFVLVSGKIDVSSQISGNESHLYTMTPGECAGTRAFVDMDIRHVTLTAVGDTVVYTLEPEDFESLLDTHPRVVYKFMRGLFRQTHQNLTRMNEVTQQLSNYITKTGGRY